MVLILIQNKNFFLQIKYIFDYFLSFFNVDYKVTGYNGLCFFSDSKIKLIISYGKKKPDVKFKNLIHIYESNLFGDNYLKLASLPEEPLGKYDDVFIIYRGFKNIQNHLNIISGPKHTLVETDIDIVASSFFMLTRYEEYLIDKRDIYGRFSAKDSLAYREGFLNRPVVNEYIDLLGKWINNFKVGINRKIFWNGRDFALCLTHDIDKIKEFSIKPPLKRIAKYLCNKENKRSLLLFREYLRSLIRNDPTNIFNFISISNDYKIKSTFFLKGGGFSKFDSGYYKKTLLLSRLIKYIRSLNNEVALHGSFNSYTDPVALEIEKEHIEKVMCDKIYGIRQHYLRFSIPLTWNIHKRAGFKYDSTMAFADFAGFRCGICHPFKPYDLYKNKIINIWEIPLVVMDSSLSFYQDLSSIEGKKIIFNLVERVKEHNGIFNILWHNTSLCKSNNPGWDIVYLNVLNYIVSQNFYNRSILEIVDDWEKLVNKKD